MVENKGALCLSCADLDHLVFLPTGSAALTRRSAKYSILSAVVLKWSRARSRMREIERRAEIVIHFEISPEIIENTRYEMHALYDMINLVIVNEALGKM